MNTLLSIETGSFLTGLVASILGISCGIIAVVMSSIAQMKKNNNNRVIKQAIIEKGLTPEEIKELLKEEPKKKNKYAALQWGLMLVGLGIGALLYMILGLNSELMQMTLMAMGMGFGLLTAFFIRLKLEKNTGEAQ